MLTALFHSSKLLCIVFHWMSTYVLIHPSSDGNVGCIFSLPLQTMNQWMLLYIALCVTHGRRSTNISQSKSTCSGAYNRLIFTTYCKLFFKLAMLTYSTIYWVDPKCLGFLYHLTENLNNFFGQHNIFYIPMFSKINVVNYRYELMIISGFFFGKYKMNTANIITWTFFSV